MLDHHAIRALLPQRHPMLLLDRVDVTEPGVCVTGYKAVTATELCYRALADDAPPHAYAYPVSLLLESFGQAAAVLWLTSPREATADPDRRGGFTDDVLMLGGLRGCRIDGSAYPGDVLRHEVRLDHVVPGTGFATGETWVGRIRIAVMTSFVAVRRAVAPIAGAAVTQVHEKQEVSL